MSQPKLTKAKWHSILKNTCFGKLFKQSTSSISRLIFMMRSFFKNWTWRDLKRFYLISLCASVEWILRCQKNTADDNQNQNEVDKVLIGGDLVTDDPDSVKKRNV